MRKNVKVRTAVTAMATVGVLGTAVLAAPAAYAEEAPTCKLTAKQPVTRSSSSGGVSIDGVGTRSGCVQDRDWITVRLRKAVSLWFDETLASVTVTGKTNISVTASKWCHLDFQVPSVGTTIHTDISTNAGGSAKSSNVFFRDAVCL
jgi:hypothetical protein